MFLDMFFFIYIYLMCFTRVSVFVFTNKSAIKRAAPKQQETIQVLSLANSIFE